MSNTVVAGDVYQEIIGGVYTLDELSDTLQQNPKEITRLLNLLIRQGFISKITRKSYLGTTISYVNDIELDGDLHEVVYWEVPEGEDDPSPVVQDWPPATGAACQPIGEYHRPTNEVDSDDDIGGSGCTDEHGSIGWQLEPEPDDEDLKGRPTIAGGAPTVVEPEVASPPEPLRFDEQLFAHLKPWVKRHWVSDDPDPFSGRNIQYAERILDYWDQEHKDEPLVYGCIAYPVPEETQKHSPISLNFFVNVELKCNQLIRDRWKIKPSALFIRNLVLTMWHEKFNPLSFLSDLSESTDPIRYTKKWAESKGRPWHDEPTTPRPVTIIQYPDGLERVDQNPKVQGAISPPPPKFWETIDQLNLVKLSSLKGQGLGLLTELRKHRSSKREKAYQDKLKGWNRAQQPKQLSPIPVSG